LPISIRVAVALVAIWIVRGTILVAPILVLIASVAILIARAILVARAVLIRCCAVLISPLIDTVLTERDGARIVARGRA
jgi:hypothetical protein